MIKQSEFYLTFSLLLTVAGGMVEKDDIHLILEYKTNDKWGKYISPRANR